LNENYREEHGLRSVGGSTHIVLTLARAVVTESNTKITVSRSRHLRWSENYFTCNKSTQPKIGYQPTTIKKSKKLLQNASATVTYQFNLNVTFK
jgi:hypothetical protein